LVKQSLFEGVLSENSDINYVDFSTRGRSQFIRQLEALIQGQEAPDAESAPAPEPPAAPSPLAAGQAEQLEQVLASGLSFLSGLFKMSTGADLAFRDQKLEVDPRTGEVRLSFKMGQQGPF
jgi:hypothetical protein